MASNTPEYQREYMKRYYASHPEYRAKQAEYQKKWRAAHPGYTEQANAYQIMKRRLLHGQTKA